MIEPEKVNLFRQSVYESVIKPKKPTDEEMTLFRRSIWQLADIEFPQLGIKDPGPVKANVNWVEWNPFGPKSKCKLMYKMNGDYKNCCVMDLQLTGRGDAIEQLRKQYKHVLAGTGISVEQTGGSAVFRLPVPDIESPNFDKDAVRSALQAASRLKEWWEEWRHVITDVQ